ncbi:MAG: Rieske [2Fe-2S] domain protein [Myxococcaceae bacterium]|nr:Rieske [2Fe-2S] domain protein [Myxococcaceae bacterium]
MITKRELVLYLDGTQRALVARGDFVRADLGERVRLADGTAMTSVLVGRVAGRLVGWVNVCRHEAIALDARAPDEDAGVMTDDRRHLLCHAHGAIYRPADGYCVSGPCSGTSLLPVAVADAAEADGAVRVTFEQMA